MKKKKWQLCGVLYLSMLGAVALVLGFAPLTAARGIAFLRAAAVGCAPVTLLCVFPYHPGMSRAKLWGTRLCTIGLSMASLLACFYLFGAIAYHSMDRVLVRFLGMLGTEITVVVPLYLLADWREKRKLHAINQKLQEQQEE